MPDEGYETETLLMVQETLVSVQTANCSMGFKQFQTMNKGLIKRNDHSFNK